jgi:hypothetical protein
MGPNTKNDCAGAAQQQFTGLDWPDGLGWESRESLQADRPVQM